MNKIIPLNIHSEYSLKEGIIRISDFVDFAAKHNLPALALTDINELGGAIEFYKSAKNNGIKPIIGCELSINTEYCIERHVLLAKNFEGYKNLVQVLNSFNRKSSYDSPTVIYDLLKEHCSGLICYTLDFNVNNSQSVSFAKYKELFLEDYYIALSDCRSQDKNKMYYAIAAQYGIQTLVTSEIFYLNKKDSKIHKNFYCVANDISDERDYFKKFSSNDFYFKSETQIRKSFDWLSDDEFDRCVANTFEILNKCNFELKVDTELHPQFPVPDDFTSESYLKHIVTKEAKNKYAAAVLPAVLQRVDEEVSALKRLNFIDNFLVAWDIIQFAKSKHIPISPGRGPLPSSLLMYLFGVSEIDPIKYNLLFNRFINKNECKTLELSLEFSPKHISKIFKYLEQKYGKAKTARTSVYSSAKLVYYDGLLSPRINKKQVENIADIICCADKSPFCMLVSSQDMSDYVPIVVDADGNNVSRYHNYEYNNFGFLLLFVYAVRELELLDNIVCCINQWRNVEIDLTKIPLDDKATYEMLNNGDIFDLFGIYSKELADLLLAIQPRNIEDLAAFFALCRPGPMDSGLAKEFISKKNSYGAVTYAHPLLKPILEYTYGCILYQEQILYILHNLAAYSFEDADIVRRYITRARDKTLEHKQVFVEKAMLKGLSDKVATEIFEQITASNIYTYNRSHALSRALILYRIAYLKCHYPDEYKFVKTIDM